jgi:hypothetical protein
MTRVFAKISYGVFNIPGFFDQFHQFVGPFQIEQTIQESLDKCFRIWFFTDKVEIKEHELRQVEIMCNQIENSKIEFRINKF